MNIYKGTSSPYQARSNLSELLNRILLDNMRNLAIGTFMNIEQTKQFLAPIVNLINSLPFAKERIIGPHVLMFSQIPRIDVYNFYRVSQKKRPAEIDFFFKTAPSNNSKTLYVSDSK